VDAALAGPACHRVEELDLADLVEDPAVQQTACRGPAGQLPEVVAAERCRRAQHQRHLALHLAPAHPVSHQEPLDLVEQVGLTVDQLHLPFPPAPWLGIQLGREPLGPVVRDLREDGAVRSDEPRRTAMRADPGHWCGGPAAGPARDQVPELRRRFGAAVQSHVELGPARRVGGRQLEVPARVGATDAPP
jgi:hypothetical protein